MTNAGPGKGSGVQIRVSLERSESMARSIPDLATALMAIDDSGRLISDRFITIHLVVAKTFGINPAIFLEYLMYWGAGDPGEWRFRTAEQIERDTCLTTQEQRTARAKLKAMGVLTEQRRGIPAQLYYHVDWPKALRMISFAPARTLKPDTNNQHVSNDERTGQLSGFNKHSNGVVNVKENGERRAPEDAPPVAVSKPTRSSPPRFQIPRDFTLTPAMSDYATKHHVHDPALEFERFTNYWQGEGRAKADWIATWRKWCLGVEERQAEHATMNGLPPEIAALAPNSAKRLLWEEKRRTAAKEQTR